MINGGDTREQAEAGKRLHRHDLTVGVLLSE